MAILSEKAMKDVIEKKDWGDDIVLLFDNNEFSVIYGTSLIEKTKRIGIRYNGSNDHPGCPASTNTCNKNAKGMYLTLPNTTWISGITFLNELKIKLLEEQKTANPTRQTVINEQIIEINKAIDDIKKNIEH